MPIRPTRAAACFIPVLLSLALGAPARAADPEVRIENEFKLSVPGEQLEAVRAYLQERYAAGNGGGLGEFGSGFTATVSDERFEDHYFDTPGLDLLEKESGVRLRQRWSLTDPASEKHGRRLLQLKLRRLDDANTINRTEVKFEVDPPRRAKESTDRHLLLGLVDRDDRPALIESLADLGVDAHAMRPALTVDQRRWRVYVSRDGSPFATLTLDEVSSRWYAWRTSFVELEIELNEIAYTEASPVERDTMQQVSQQMVNDLRAAFPAIVQDQTPKYNKAFAALAKQVPAFESIVVYGEEVLALTIAGTTLLLLAVVFLGIRIRTAHRVRRALAEAASRTRATHELPAHG